MMFLKDQFQDCYFYYFLNYICCIFNDNYKINLYADSTSLFIYINYDYEIGEHMKLYVGKLVLWLTINNLKLIIDKTQIFNYFNTTICNSIHIDNVDIELVNIYKLLGITLDNIIKYSLHIDLLSIIDNIYIFFFNYDSKIKKHNFII